ncbi:MAG: anaerobic magnesium-protoporphyrin monomethyl ester cyclase [Methanobacterium sp.]|uniref:B12-binding domain-containing radical SAM protein n=1 Tax=Methanobacterium sp. TaxID=2164 RepID=UPI0003C9A0E5|nr:radical SAM protein [Methanobacterium sp.]MDI3550685.1 anaerobic magnesium-protoporphyrin monomethyl ester cyclase [Methanobacterium sp.]CDG65567.1 Radical SAM domain-containing protein [Methanobacterium sp. MB1]
MKVTFINPPQTNSKYKFIGVVAPPLGISYMAAVLEKNGYTVSIIDASALEMTWEDLEKAVQEESPQVVAITALTPTIKQADKSAQIVKKVLPETTVVMGGYHPTFNYQEILEKDYVDIVIMGEGEYTMLELVQTLESGGDLSQVRGLALKGKVTSPRPLITDMDDLPFPARHLLPMDHYRMLNIKTGLATMITSRGCPMQCSFCASAALHGPKLRKRSPENVVDEMEHLVRDHQVNTIAFLDDTFTLDHRMVEAICDQIQERNLDVFWGCTARVDTLSDDLLEKMRKAGCIALFMGVESADQQVLDSTNKNITIDKIRQAFQLSKKHKIRTIASVVLGMPGDTKDSIKRTVKFVRELNPSYAIFSLATPYPGTRFYKESFEKNLIKVKDWSKYTLISPVLETVDCSMEELRKLQYKAFRNFYLRPGYILKQAWMDGPILIKAIAGVIREVI